MGLYANTVSSLDELKEGFTVTISNGPSNGGRPIILLKIHSNSVKKGRWLETA